VLLTTWPDAARVSLDCGAQPIHGVAPLEFEFPAGPATRCVADVSADHYKPALVYIDRQYLFDHGEMTNRTHVTQLPRIEPVYGPVNVWGAIALSIEAGIEELVNVAHRAAVATQPDVTLKIALQPESSS